MNVSAVCRTLASFALLLAATTGCQKTESPAASAVTARTAAPAPAPEPAKCADCVPVTIDNFNRAETDRTFYGVGKLQGGFSKFRLFRVPTPLA